MKRKVLFVLPMLPYPLSTGGHQAIFNGFSSIKDDVDVFITYGVPFYNKRVASLKLLQSAAREVRVIPFVYNPVKGTLNFVFYLFYKIVNVLKLSQKNIDFYCSQIPLLFNVPKKEYTDFINDLIRTNKIDIVQLEMCGTLSHVLTLPSDVKKIFVHHELNFIARNLHIQQIGVTKTRLAYAELGKMLEIGLLNKCDAVITLSDIDKQKLLEQGVKSPIYTSFAVVNTTVSETTNSNYSNTTLSFVGPASAANTLSVKWFLENCWEKLLSQDSSYTLKIIGNWPEDKRNELNSKYKNIQFLGFVPNLSDALNDTIMIVPITVGSGIRMKILEAASLGIPFVSTTVGAEGLPFESGRDCFKADTPESFVKAIVDLKDKSLREKFAQNANAIVKEKYSIEALRKNRLEIYDKVLGDAKS